MLRNLYGTRLPAFDTCRRQAVTSA